MIQTCETPPKPEVVSFQKTTSRKQRPKKRFLVVVFNFFSKMLLIPFPHTRKISLFMKSDISFTVERVRKAHEPHLPRAHIHNDAPGSNHQVNNNNHSVNSAVNAVTAVNAAAAAAAAVAMANNNSNRVVGVCSSDDNTTTSQTQVQKQQCSQDVAAAQLSANLSLNAANFGNSGGGSGFGGLGNGVGSSFGQFKQPLQNTVMVR